MPYLPYVAHDPLYRSKMSAVAEGENLRLRLLLHNDARCTSAFLLVHPDNGDEFSIPMEYTGKSDENYEWWECRFSLDEGLYWYSFYYFGEGGRQAVTKFDRGVGLVSPEGDMWQLTVYSQDYETPEWPTNGIIYQIFPDRFFASGAEKSHIPEDRYLRDDWGGTPAFIDDGSKFSICNDYFGGDLEGIRLKLPYLKSLGVGCIYLNPIFEAHSNHRYNTANYMKIDPSLGNIDDFQNLCRDAAELNIRIILDGVFSHTGTDSIYFNKNNRYDSIGASQSQSSPFRSWYNFDDSNLGYKSWWGVPSLPETNELDPSYDRFINGEDGVIRHWLRLGAAGWRLDVADELPDGFLDNLRRAVKSEKPNAFILGEVWEDATNKVSYGKRRRFLRGAQLDSVMNYPFCNAIINFIKTKDAESLCDTVLDIVENYPPQAVRLLMNHIGTHDTPRILTALGEGYEDNPDRWWQSTQKLSAKAKEQSERLLRLAAILQYTLPGIPSLYYGDEVGMEGYGDPFCRGCFPWERLGNSLNKFYIKLGKMRLSTAAFGGDFAPLWDQNGCFAFMRTAKEQRIIVAVNAGDCEISIPLDYIAEEIFFGAAPKGGILTVPANDFAVFRVKTEL